MLVRTDERCAGSAVYSVFAGLPSSGGDVSRFERVGTAHRVRGNDKSAVNGGVLAGWEIDWWGEDGSDLVERVRLNRHSITWSEGGFNNLKRKLGMLVPGGH